MQLARVEVAWSGAGVNGAAVNVLHYAADVGDPDSGAISAAYVELRPILNTSTSVTIPNSGDVIEDTTGTLVRPWTSTLGGTALGTAAFNPAAGVGAVVGWTTGGIIDGRRLRGRTFIVPLATVAYDADGTLTTTAIAALEDFANALMASGPLAVWHRPTTSGGSDGNSYGVIGFRVRDKVAVLRSRRD